MSRLVDLSDADDIHRMSTLIGQWVTRKAGEYEYFESRALVAECDPLVSLNEFGNLAQRLGNDLFAKVRKDRKKDFRTTPVKGWSKMLDSFEMSAPVVDEDSFQDAMARLIARHQLAEELSCSALLTRDLRDTDTVIETVSAEFDSRPNNKQAAIAQFITSLLPSA